jgi:hypothetical protein
MKIFDSAPSILLKKPRSWPLIIGSLVVLVACIALVAALLYQRNAHALEISKLNAELVASKNNADRMKSDLGLLQAKFDAAVDRASTCTSNLQAETAKVGAFAKQAAACEVIRKKLHFKD